MAKNLKLFFDRDGSPRVRGPSSEKLLMTFLEVDVQGSDQICHDLMDDITAVEDGSDDSREFIGNAHSVTISADGVVIDALALPDDEPTDEPVNSKATIVNPRQYRTGLKHFREVLEDWEAFILDEQSPA